MCLDVFEDVLTNLLESDISNSVKKGYKKWYSVFGELETRNDQREIQSCHFSYMENYVMTEKNSKRNHIV